MSQSSAQIRSSMTGGAATLGGVVFQLKYACFLVAEDALGFLGDLVTDRRLTIEPRVLSGDQFSRWDISQSPSGRLYEVKTIARRSDILEWIDRSTSAAVQSENRQYRLVYSSADQRLQQTVRRLTRIALEADTASSFEEFLCREEIRDANEILALVGPDPRSLLRRLKLTPKSEEDLDVELEDRLINLVGAQEASRLRDFLFHRLAIQGANRSTIEVRALVDELRDSQGFTLYEPPAVIDGSVVKEVLFVLQRCVRPLPIAVLAASRGVTEDVLRRDLEQGFRSGIIIEEGGLCRPSFVRDKLRSPNQAVLIAKVLQQLLHFIKTCGKPSDAKLQTRNAMSLASACSDGQPGVVAELFESIEKVLKRLGNKGDVLRAARMSIEAAERRARGREDVESEARSLVCGVAWAEQRMDRLAEARIAAQDARERALAIDSPVTAAFCTKCLGRLLRLEAEGMSVGLQRRALLLESLQTLTNAKKEFTSLGHKYICEVGDTVSLMGRTYLSLENFDAAATCVRDAYPLVDEVGKDFLDLLLLDGDVLAATGDHEAARERYSQVLLADGGTDNEISEIRARAHHRRALSFSTSWQNPASRAASERDFAAAQHIWCTLAEYSREEQVKWDHWKCATGAATRLTKTELAVLENEKPFVRNRVVERHAAIRAENARPTGPRREKYGLGYWKKLIAEARETMHIENRSR